MYNAAQRFISHCPDCGAPTSVADEAYCAYSYCLWNNKPSESTPPVENSEAPGASGAKDGRGVCKPGAGMSFDDLDIWGPHPGDHRDSCAFIDPADDCTPLVENSEAPGASGAKDGQGVCALTIDQPYARMYVDGVATRYASAALLKAAYVKSIRRSGCLIEKNTSYANALWDGVFAINETAHRFVDGAVRCGCLLHLVPA